MTKMQPLVMIQKPTVGDSVEMDYIGICMPDPAQTFEISTNDEPHPTLLDRVARGLATEEESELTHGR